MKNLKLLILNLSLFLLVSACQSVKEKTDAIIEKENKRLEKYIGKSVEEVKIDLGMPNEDYKNSNGNLELVYKTKKYGISCERKFEVNSSSVVIGFVSNGCF